MEKWRNEWGKRGNMRHCLKGMDAPGEINLIVYLPLAQPTEISCPDLDLNPDHRRLPASKDQQVLWLRKCISPLSHEDNGLD